MTIIEAISRFDAQHNNAYTQEEKIAWLSRVDYEIWQEIVKTHEHEETQTFSGYNADTPLDTRLLAEPPYDTLYLRYMEAQMHYLNDEFARYNNAITVYNTDIAAFEAWYNRTHKPVSTTLKFF